MLPSNIFQRAVTVTKEVAHDAVSLLSEAVLGTPIKAQALNCIVDLGSPCSLCGSCGADKRRYWIFCWQCNYCSSDCRWCQQPSCACDYC